MKLIYKGKYTGKVEEFESAKKVKNAIKYKEVETLEDMVKILTIPANILQILLIIITLLIIGFDNFDKKIIIFLCSFVLSVLLMIPHELLHAICYKEKVYMYTNLKQMMLFIIGEDHLSKWKFVFMSLLPNLLFGFIPYVLFLINNDLLFLGFLGMVSITYGMGDYYNIWNTIRQVPKNGLVFAKGHNSYWYVPELGARK